MDKEQKRHVTSNDAARSSSKLLQAFSAFLSISIDFTHFTNVLSLSTFSISKHFQALQAWRAHFCQHRHFCQHIESKQWPLERPRFVQNRRVASVEGNGGNRQKLLSLSSNSHSCRFRNSSLHIFNILQSSCMQCLPIISISHCQ